MGSLHALFPSVVVVILKLDVTSVISPYLSVYILTVICTHHQVLSTQSNHGVIHGQVCDPHRGREKFLQTFVEKS
jgi:hypothetical protein